MSMDLLKLWLCAIRQCLQNMWKKIMENKIPAPQRDPAVFMLPWPRHTVHQEGRGAASMKGSQRWLLPPLLWFAERAACHMTPPLTTNRRSTTTAHSIGAARIGAAGRWGYLLYTHPQSYLLYTEIWCSSHLYEVKMF